MPVFGYPSPLLSSVEDGVTATASNSSRIIIDGTPIRIVGLAMAGALGVVMLRWAGFKFNVAI